VRALIPQPRRTAGLEAPPPETLPNVAQEGFCRGHERVDGGVVVDVCDPVPALVPRPLLVRDPVFRIQLAAQTQLGSKFEGKKIAIRVKTISQVKNGYTSKYNRSG